MGQAGRIVALGLTLTVGVLAGFLVARAGRPSGAVSAEPAAAVAVTITQTVPADPVTVTATVAPQPNNDPTGPKANGNYLVGSELAPGTWKCGEPGSFTTWITRDQANGVVDIGSSTLAVVSTGAYIVDLNDCAGSWSLAG